MVHDYLYVDPGLYTQTHNQGDAEILQSWFLANGLLALQLRHEFVCGENFGACD